MGAITVRCTKREEKMLQASDGQSPPTYSEVPGQILTFNQYLAGGVVAPIGTVVAIVLTDSADYPNFAVGTDYTLTFTASGQQTTG